MTSIESKPLEIYEIYLVLSIFNYVELCAGLILGSRYLAWTTVALVAHATTAVAITVTSLWIWIFFESGTKNTN